MVSVVCPFYNEEGILEAAIGGLLRDLELLDEAWELIVVNDGSTDRSAAIVERLAARQPRLRLLGYPRNEGRGYALRTGIAAARGDVVVTTEIDGSWGPDVVRRIMKAFREHPDADVVIASPHLPGGGYRNVPWRRVMLSTWGNYVIRAGLNRRITMNTGMTRGYRRERLRALPLVERGKELHLEIVNKALAFGYHIVEIPATVEWGPHRHGRRTRRTPSAIPHTIHTHLLFSVLAAPFRYLSVLSAVFGIGAVAFEAWAAYRLLFTHEVAVFLAVTGFFLGLFGLLVFVVAVLASQNTALQRDLWHIQAVLQARDQSPPRE